MQGVRTYVDLLEETTLKILWIHILPLRVYGENLGEAVRTLLHFR